MISAGDFKNGVTVEIDGNIYQILEFQHVKPGKGAAFVRTKLKNIISGGVVEKTFRPTEKFPKAHIDRKDMQYLYRDGDLFTQWKRILSRATSVRRACDHRDRAWIQGRYSTGSYKTCNCRDRSNCYGTIVRRTGRCTED